MVKEGVESQVFAHGIWKKLQLWSCTKCPYCEYRMKESKHRSKHLI